MIEWLWYDCYGITSMITFTILQIMHATWSNSKPDDDISMASIHQIFDRHNFKEVL
jgi:hypothetical protein